MALLQKAEKPTLKKENRPGIICFLFRPRLFAQQIIALCMRDKYIFSPGDALLSRKKSGRAAAKISKRTAPTKTPNLSVESGEGSRSPENKIITITKTTMYKRRVSVFNGGTPYLNKRTLVTDKYYIARASRIIIYFSC